MNMTGNASFVFISGPFMGRPPPPFPGPSRYQALFLLPNVKEASPVRDYPPSDYKEGAGQTKEHHTEDYMRRVLSDSWLPSHPHDFNVALLVGL